MSIPELDKTAECSNIIDYVSNSDCTCGQPESALGVACFLEFQSLSIHYLLYHLQRPQAIFAANVQMGYEAHLLLSNGVGQHIA